MPILQKSRAQYLTPQIQEAGKYGELELIWFFLKLFKYLKEPK